VAGLWDRHSGDGAEAIGISTPDRLQDAPLENTITNGNFVIRRSAEDEQTTWTFDFSKNPDFAAFSTANSLASARLTLTLTPTSPLTASDIVRIEGLSSISSAQFQNLPINTTSTIQLELLDFYASGRILEILSQGSQGQIPMFYSGNTILSSARLDLTAE
jgi:hypothetical protein